MTPTTATRVVTSAWQLDPAQVLATIDEIGRISLDRDELQP
jgi:hypothetical protein